MTRNPPIDDGNLLRRNALRNLMGWMAVAAVFGIILWRMRGAVAGQQFASGYLLELGLSADNAFVFWVIFDRFQVSPADQSRVLAWGAAGAIVLRGAFILAGLELVRVFPAVLYAFGAFLVVTGVRLWLSRAGGPPADPAAGLVFRACRQAGVRPLVAILVLVEATDLVFAVDSIPAVLAITPSALVALASNLLAVVALRSLYLALASALPRVRRLRAGLALILVLIGLKMLAARWIELPTAATLAAIAVILAACVAPIRRWIT